MNFPEGTQRLRIPTDLSLTAVQAAESLARSTPSELHCYFEWAGVTQAIGDFYGCDVVLHDDLDDTDMWWVVFANGDIVGSEGV